MGKLKKRQSIRVNRQRHNAINPTYLKHMEQVNGSGAVVDEIVYQLENGIISIPDPVSVPNTYGDWTLSFRGNEEYRPGDALSWNAVQRMLLDGSVIFGLEMKRSEVFRVFSEGRYSINSPDKELAEVTTAGMDQIITKFADDVTWAAMAYGSYFGEMTFKLKSKYELGLSKSAGAQTKFWVPDVPASVFPQTVDHIRRVPSTFAFDGFVQDPNDFRTQKIPVPVGRALVIPINSYFRNLWGRSALTPAYPSYVWKDVTTRVMARYLDRMATPVVVGKGPMFGSVTLSDESTPVRPLKLALHLAASLAKSNAVAIPSDVDERGNPLWSLEYLTAADRSQPFISVLEYFTQDILRSILIADRSISQPSVSSGSIGSEAIGRVHSAASSMASEMLLLQILFYINKYFMPVIARHNRGQTPPPLRMRVQPITSREFELLRVLMSVAGNSPASQEFYSMVDWRGLAETSSVPLLSEADFKKKKEELQKEAEEKMLAQKKVFDQSAKQKDEGPPAAGKNGANDKGDDKKLEEAISDIVNSDNGFLILSPEDLERMGVDSVKLFNPYRDRLGRFASGPSGGGGGGTRTTRSGGGAADPVATAKKKRDGSLVKTTGKILGLAALGAVGLAVLGAATSGSSEPEIEPGDTVQDLIDKGLISEKDAEELKELIESGAVPADTLVIPGQIEHFVPEYPVFDNIEDAKEYYRAALAQKGIMIDDIPLITGNLAEAQLAGRGDALYNPILNTLALSPWVEEGLKNGDPAAVNAMVHELMHNRQDAGVIPDPRTFSSEYVGYLEGQNELMTDLAIASMTGSTYDAYLGYTAEQATWAGLAAAGAQRNNEDPVQFLARAHVSGENYDVQLSTIQELFPDRNITSFPSIGQLDRWLDEDYGIDGQEELDALLIAVVRS